MIEHADIDTAVEPAIEKEYELLPEQSARLAPAGEAGRIHTASPRRAVQLPWRQRRPGESGEGALRPGEWREKLGEFDWVIVTAPAAQAADLLASTSISSADFISFGCS